MTNESSFEELLEIDSSVHDRILRALATEMYKMYQNISKHITNYHEWNIHTKASKSV